MAKLTSTKINLVQINQIHIFDTKFQMQEIPVEAAERCSGKSLLVQASYRLPAFSLKFYY